ncbi:LPS-assembly protein LptD, partial [Campylobacter jejuni]|nr:LPS-assembly protein LptD [Campylobacter jejuni]MCE3579347.1 LPS-assembly protein LptD [Campylobacter jejuni]
LSDNFQEGLWIDATYLNDVDYLNLGSRDYRDLNSLVTSKINYFLADENNFYGAYARYYIDTSKLSNNTTLQEYPSFQYHRFLNNLFDERLRYSFDAS